MSDPSASSEGARRLLAWRVSVGIFVFVAVLCLALGIVTGIRGFWPGTAIFAVVGLFEGWRATTVFRRKPGAMKLDLATEQAGRDARMRRSAWLITGCAAGCAALAPFGGHLELWLLAGLLAAGAALTWFTLLWLIPRSTRGGHA